MNGERYDSPAAARREARLLLDRLANMPNGTREWDELAEHVEALYTAASEAER